MIRIPYPRKSSELIRLKLAGKMDNCVAPSETPDPQNVSPKSVTDFS